MAEKLVQYEKSRIRLFLKANGWSKTARNSEWESWIKEDTVGVDFNDDEIAFVDDTGDFCHIRLDYYALVGYVFVNRLILPVIPEGV